MPLFCRCALWGQIHGLSYECFSEEAVQRVADKIGSVLDVVMESKGLTRKKYGRARINLSGFSPFETGSLNDL